MNEFDTHKIICKNPKALTCLLEESVILGIAAKKGKKISQGDALVGRDILVEAGFEWGKDFYLTKG